MSVKIHNVKTHPDNFARWIMRQKSFELRFNDRDYRAGDEIHQQEFDPTTGKYSGRVGIGRIVYVLTQFKGLEQGFCIIECPFLKMKVQQGEHE
jgi:ParB family chromosome partitioning protein